MIDEEQLEPGVEGDDVAELEEYMSGDDVTAEPPQMSLPGLEPPAGLWPPVQGYRITRINFGVGGGVQLSAVNDADRELAEKIRLGEELVVTMRGTVEKRGHKVVREKGDIIGIDGVASLTVTRMLETPQAVVRLMEMQERMLEVQAAYNRASAELSLVEMSEPARKAVSRSLSNIFAATVGWPELEDEPDEPWCVLCEHHRDQHIDEGVIDGRCVGLREWVEDGEECAEECKCEAFAGPADSEIVSAPDSPVIESANPVKEEAELAGVGDE